MREERFGGITVRLTGGDDREGGGDGPLVVLMHGFGAPKSYAKEIPPGMEEATDHVVQMINAMQEQLGVPNDRLVVGGFSQGSMAACNAVFTRDVAPAGLVILSGTPVNLNSWSAGMKAGLPVFQSHGTQDPLLSFQAAEQLHHVMLGAGLSAEWVPFRGGHELPMPVLAGLGQFVSELDAG